ncbi:GNAT family N-acetyltransferase [uncultured Psychroserpens sp.]|uniref:GNAT family N-acetyltransferase n=1 Tax=uncultured Psychroserpens sp. TaxID=255436 RepID=UPI0026388FBC|nr:GNAT family N-acetyltransferase [uncultured Psychroserpens sp.]
MIKLETFKIEDWKHIEKWISNESELIQFAGSIFSFPIDETQIESYLSHPNRMVFKIVHANQQPIGMAEIYLEEGHIAKLARILIGEKTMRGKGIGTQLIDKLTKYTFNTLQKKRILLNVYQWNIGAIKCYEKAGFSKTDKPIVYIKVGHQEWATIEMEKYCK